MILLSGTADRPCVPREFETGNIVCVCNMTYCDTVSKVTPVRTDHFVQYSTSQSGLRFQKTEGLFSDIPHPGGEMLVTMLKDWESWLVL
jgi:glucosylceramidase